jgi:type II secretory ATPase GspE/PulE/Tfp pilus assembly ATPase PilB-like protein
VHCRGKGTVGRTLLAEVITPDERFFAHLRAGNKAAAAEHWLHELGGRTIAEHAIDKLRAGLIDPTMAERSIGWLRFPESARANALDDVGAANAA